MNIDHRIKTPLVTYSAVILIMACIVFVLQPILAIYSGATPPHTDFLDWWKISQAIVNGQALPNVVFNYPPTFALFNLPFGWLDYPSAYLIFIFASISGYALVIGKICKSTLGLIFLTISTPAIYVILFGQNGLLTASIAGVALLSLEKRREIFAGILIAILSIKPQLGLLFPIVLIAMGAWRAFITTTVVSICFFFGGMLVLGVDAYFDWINKVILLSNSVQKIWLHVFSIYSFMLSIGAPVKLAYTTQLIVSLLITFSVWRVWRHCESWSIRCAVLATATCMTSPYILLCDLTWLGLALAWCTPLIFKQDWSWGELMICAFILLLPTLNALQTVLGSPINFQIGPFVIGLFYLVLLRRSQVFKYPLSIDRPRQFN